MDRTTERYLKRHTEALVKAVGVEAACAATGRSKATLGRYYAMHEEHADRFIPVDAVARLEAVAGYPHVTAALAELAGVAVDRAESRSPGEPGPVSADFAAVSRRFAELMSRYADAVADEVITKADVAALMGEAIELQRVLTELKLHLEAHAAGSGTG
jgi:hypothetical protein